jgi:tetratricopeptide (TPR) repeat protein
MCPLVFVVILTATVNGSSDSGAKAITPEEEKAFEAAKTAAGAPGELVKLALWAEGKGMSSQRDALLKSAVALDPNQSAARGLQGKVEHKGLWQSPEEVGAAVRSEAAVGGKLAEYNVRRARLDDIAQAEISRARALEQQGKNAEARVLQARADRKLAPAHQALGQWCEANQLKAEAQAHFTTAVRLNPYLETAWKHLGCIKRNGRWMTREQIAVEQEEATAQRQADRHWEPLLQRWKTRLNEDGQRSNAEQSLDAVVDPRAVPSIIKTFVTARAKDQDRAVRLLSQIATPASTRELSVIAVRSDYPPVRQAATEALRGRDGRDYAEPLVKMIHSPWTYEVRPVQGPGSKGSLIVDSARFHLVRTYDAPQPFQLGSNFRGYVGIDPNGLPIVISGRTLEGIYTKPSAAASILHNAEQKTAEMLAAAQIKAAAAREWMLADMRDIESNNSTSAFLNDRISSVLHETLQAPLTLGSDEDAWNSWWYEQMGYRYTPPPKETIQQQSPQSYVPRIMSCFAAGTPVRTLKGHQPIESLNVGDQVLSQDASTGKLSFQPILAIHHNPPDKTLRIALDNGDALVASLFHRFWLAGRGWRMARELEKGDEVRTLTGPVRVSAIEPAEVVPVFNLDVAHSRTFFVGGHDALVHDNTMPARQIAPFDARPDLARLGKSN